MLSLTFRNLCLGGLILVLFGYFGSGGLDRILPSEDNTLRDQLAERWAQKVSVELPHLDEVRPRLAVTRVVRDSEGILTKQLRKWIGRQNVRLVLNDRWADPLYRTGLLTEPISLDEAALNITESQADYVVIAQVDEWVTFPSYEARLIGQIRILRMTDRREIFVKHLAFPEQPEPAEDRTIVAERSASAPSKPVRDSELPLRLSLPNAQVQASLAPTSSNMGPLWGAAAWLLTVLLAPLGFSRQIARILRHQSNRANALLLIQWFAGVLLSGWFVWGCWFCGPVCVVSLLIGGLLSLPYLGYVCQRLMQG